MLRKKVTESLRIDILKALLLKFNVYTDHPVKLARRKIHLDSPPETWIQGVRLRTTLVLKVTSTMLYTH